jgi:hypothetical protein
VALREIKVSWETFNFKVWCVIGPHRLLPAYVKKKHRRIYKPPKNTTNLGGCYFHSKPKMGGIIWLPRVPRTCREMGYLAHEVGHAVVDMHAQRGLNLDSNNDETFCYAIAQGVTEILEGCKK